MKSFQDKYKDMLPLVEQSINSVISSFKDAEDYASVNVSYNISQSTLLSHLNWLISKEQEGDFELRDAFNFASYTIIPQEEPETTTSVTSDDDNAVKVVDLPTEIISISQPPIQIELDDIRETIRIESPPPITNIPRGGGSSSSGGFLFDTSSLFNPTINIL